MLFFAILILNAPSIFAQTDMQVNMDVIAEKLKERISQYTPIEQTDNAQYQFIATLVVMNYVQTIVSPPRYGVYRREASYPNYLPVITAEDSLLKKAGICGNQIDAFIKLMSKLGINTREVQFYYENYAHQRDSHITVEVEWEHQWHFFDVTWGSFFSDANDLTMIPSYADIQKKGYEFYQQHLNKIYGWLNYAIFYKLDPMIYLFLPDSKIDVVFDGNGIVRPYLRENKYPLISIPNYFGYMMRRSGNYSDIVQQYAIPSWANTLTLTTGGYNCPGGGKISIKNKNHTDEYRIVPTMRKKIVVKNAANDIEISVARNGLTQCFVVIADAQVSL